MANSIEKVKTYITAEQSLQTLFRDYSLTGDLAKPFKGKGNGTVSIKTVTLGSNTAGTYDPDTGLPTMNFTVKFVDKVLSHDRGNSIPVDRLEDEAALGDNLVIAYNHYNRQVLNPTMDKANLNAIASFEGIVANQDTAATVDTVQTQIDAGLDELYKNGLSTSSAVVLYIKTSVARLLKNSLKDAGGFTFGEWNGVVDKKVAIYGDTIKAKVVEIPDGIMPDNVQFLLVPVEAVQAVIADKGTTLHDKVVGHGTRKLILDIMAVFDCFVLDEAKELIYKSYTA